MSLRLYCTQRWPELDQLIGCYFHEDFIDDYGSPEGAIDAMLHGVPEQNEPPRSTKSLRQGLRELEEFIEFARDYLRKHPEEEEDVVLDMFGCRYNTYADGLTPLQWLEHLRKRIREHLEKIGELDAK